MTRKGKTAERGYGGKHQNLRKHWQKKIDAGGVVCARCGGVILPGMPWDLGHVDGDRSRYTGPEHQRCNRATASRASHSKFTPATRDVDVVRAIVARYDLDDPDQRAAAEAELRCRFHGPWPSPYSDLPVMNSRIW